MYKFGKTSLDEISRVWPEGRQVLLRAMSYQFIDFGLPKGSGGRTQEYQDYLYAQGRTRPGEIVTWTRNSNHLVGDEGYGFAFDVVPYIDGKYVWKEKPCLILATLIFRAANDLDVKIDWGYHLWRKDMPHFQKKGLQNN